MIKILIPICLLFSQMASAEPYNAEEVKSIMVAQQEWVGTYKVEQLWGFGLYNEYDLPITASFSRDKNDDIVYRYERAARSKGEIDDGSCNNGTPLDRTLLITDASVGHFDNHYGKILAYECENGTVGKRKEISLTSIKIVNGQLIIDAVLTFGVSVTYTFNQK